MNRKHRKKLPSEKLLLLDQSCVICRNEGRHEAARPHVKDGQA